MLMFFIICGCGDSLFTKELTRKVSKNKKTIKDVGTNYIYHKSLQYESILIAYPHKRIVMQRIYSLRLDEEEISFYFDEVLYKLTYIIVCCYSFMASTATFFFVSSTIIIIFVRMLHQLTFYPTFSTYFPMNSPLVIIIR